MAGYEDTGFDRFLSRGLPSVRQQTEFEISVRSPYIPSGQLKGKVPIINIDETVSDLANITGISEVQTGTIPSGFAVSLITTLTDKSRPERVLLAIPEIAVYQDSIATENALPSGSAVDSGFTYHTNFDLRANINSSAPGKGITFRYRIGNASGNPHVFIFHVRWRYLGEPTAV